MAHLMKHGRLIALTIAFLVAVVALHRPAPAQEKPTPAATAPFPTPDEVKKNWPSFRGPGGSGLAPDATLPPAWDGKTGEGILWKTAIPVDGASSPVVWDKNVFVTGGSKEESRVFCFDADTGALRWSALVKIPEGARPEPPDVNEETGYAAPTPVADGRRVYAVFPTGEVAAFDLTGKQVWARNIGPLNNTYGYAASPTIHQDRLLLQLDLDDPKKSRMLALDTATGKEVWSTPRPFGGSWSSPILAEYKKKAQLIACGNPFVIGYDPANGKELWRIKALELDIAPTPIVVGKKIIAISSSVVALEPGVEDPAWDYSDCVPDIASPVSDGKYVYVLSTGGDLRCVEAATGKEVWAHDLDAKFSASPVIVGKTLLAVSESGVAYLVATGNKYKELGSRELNEDCVASPAPVGARLYIRGKLNLYCIGRKP